MSLFSTDVSCCSGKKSRKSGRFPSKRVKLFKCLKASKACLISKYETMSLLKHNLKSISKNLLLLLKELSVNRFNRTKFSKQIGNIDNTNITIEITNKQISLNKLEEISRILIIRNPR